MAYMSQDHKAKIAVTVKAICKKYGVKGTLSVQNHSTLCLNIKSGPIDFIGNTNAVCSKQPRYNDRQYQPDTTYTQVNPYWYQDHFDGKALKFLKEIVPAMYGPDYYDHSDIQTDYFNCSHYISVNIGKWDKPYQLTA